jgi:alanine-glyoxylate transaminase/serine-glyoxylate transaminase/serine-pyruvate transaminase
MWETGHFRLSLKKMADKLGIKSEFMGGDWRKPADPAAIEKRLKEDTGHAIKAVCIVHNETSTGVVSDISAVRQAIDCREAPSPAAGRHDLVAGLDSTIATMPGVST